MRFFYHHFSVLLFSTMCRLTTTQSRRMVYMSALEAGEGGGTEV